MGTKFVRTGGSQRSFRAAVWAGRTVGWVLLFVAIFGILQAEFVKGTMAVAFRTLPSVALGVVAGVWILALELFLHFFDRYMSRN